MRRPPKTMASTCCQADENGAPNAKASVEADAKADATTGLNR